MTDWRCGVLSAVACLAPMALAYGDTTALAVCYNWGCRQYDVVELDARVWADAGNLLDAASSPAHERALLAVALGRLYRGLGEVSPVAADRAGNTLDAEVEGRMDCIDHAVTSTQLLHGLQERGRLRFHRVVEVQRRTRFWVMQHLSAAIEEKFGYALATTGVAVGEPTPRRFVVDSWFADPGEPATVMPAELWMEGEGPDVE